MTPYDTSRSLTRRVPIYDSSSVVEYHSPVNSTKLLISRSVSKRSNSNGSAGEDEMEIEEEERNIRCEIQTGR